MSTFNIKLIAENLGKSLENLGDQVEQELNQAIKDTAEATYAKIISQAQQQLHSTRSQFLNGLRFSILGDNTYLIYLDGEFPNMIENGWGAYDMKKTLLKSEKVVEIGSRSGEKWVRTSKEGNKYASVPFKHKINSNGGSGDLAQEIKNLTSFNRQGKKQKITKIFKDDFGQPIAGKVAVAESENPLLNKLTKYQHVNEKGRVSSIYMTYRIISEKSEGWYNSGYEGVHLFTEAERWVESEIENIINTLIG